MASYLRTTFFFKQDQGGWSETWVLLNGTLTAELQNVGLNGFAYKFALARLKCCGQGAVLLGIRISDRGVANKPYPSGLVSLSGNGLGGTIVNTPAVYGAPFAANQNPDQLQTCLLIPFKNAANQRKLLYMAGIPDDVDTTNPDGPTSATNAQWGINYQQWGTIAQNGNWGFVCRSLANAPIPVAQYLNVAGPGSQLILVANANIPGYALGVPIQVTGATMIDRAYTSPNGRWIVTSVAMNSPNPGQTSYTLNNSSNITVVQVLKPGNVVSVLYTPAAIVSIGDAKQVAHKRGKPAFLFRGRVRKPARV